MTKTQYQTQAWADERNLLWSPTTNTAISASHLPKRALLAFAYSFLLSPYLGTQAFLSLHSFSFAFNLGEGQNSVIWESPLKRPDLTEITLQHGHTPLERPGVNMKEGTGRVSEFVVFTIMRFNYYQSTYNVFPVKWYENFSARAKPWAHFCRWFDPLNLVLLLVAN